MRRWCGRPRLPFYWGQPPYSSVGYQSCQAIYTVALYRGTGLFQDHYSVLVLVLYLATQPQSKSTVKVRKFTTTKKCSCTALQPQYVRRSGLESMKSRKPSAALTFFLTFFNHFFSHFTFLHDEISTTIYLLSKSSNSYLKNITWYVKCVVFGRSAV